MKKSHIFKLRVYYSEVDVLGIVYHTNYVNYMERARCDWLRVCGFPIHQTCSDYEILFAVKHLDVSYLAPAKLDQELYIVSKIVKAKKASLMYDQKVCADANGLQVLCHAKICIVCLGQNLRPKAIPQPIYENFKGVCCDNES
ncbi:MAG: YbgC/FadM family acyl-CoA thioesterase [Francisellaceae bacterium]|jgi:acyl-CoA thioester hydrolase|nr:YbgC/FadM family acyl-CoA thioesterase [Francisellaceae bacterium]